MTLRRAAAAAVLALLAGAAPAAELSGYAGVEVRAFAHRAAFPAQREDDASFIARPELYHAWDGGAHGVVVTPFLRRDSADARRSHFDLREALYIRTGERWSLRAGVGQVFWGVTESRHLVDVINQADLVEDLDGEDRLGQPMVELTLRQGPGTLDLFVLPGFRERTFAGPRGRLRSEPFVDGHRARYESGAGQHHVDLALRWSHFFGDYDVALSHFMGTGREPRLLAERAADGSPVLIPRYEQVHRTGLELQATRGAWLWKLEAVHEGGQGPSHLDWVAGFEFTWFNLGGRGTDVGLLAEHLFDSRGSHAPQTFQNDLFVGLRLALNDAQSSELLAGVIQDLGGSGAVMSLEASRRLGERWRLEVEARSWSGMSRDDRQRSLTRDDHLLVRLLRYF